ITGAAQDAHKDLSVALENLNLLESSTTYPLLLSLFRKRRSGVIDDGALVRCVEMLRGFILRRFVCGDSSRGYGQTFVRALQSDETNPIASLERYLLQRGWPDDRRFTEAFASFPLYRRG